MPHCTLEYSDNIPHKPDLRKLLLELGELLVATGQFERANIKSRAVEHDLFVVGDGAPERAFVALEIGILDGRSDELKAGLSESALELLERHFSAALAQTSCSITVQVADIHRASYRKRVSSAT